MEFKQYPSYKKSGVEWLGDVPEHWESNRLKKYLIERNEKNSPIKTDNLLSVTMYQGVIPVSEKQGNGGNKPKENLEHYKISYPNDIVLNSMNVIVGSVGLNKYTGLISPAYYALYNRNKNNNIKFFSYIFHNPFFQKGLFGLGNGIMYKESEDGKLNTIRLKIPMEKLNQVVLPCPSISEQNQIVAFLDTETARIDNLVAKQEKLIELLEEQRKSIISHAVTKGLNPNAPMKDSGVEWLGDVPESWVEQKIKFISKLINEKTSQKSNVIALENIESWTGKYIETESSFESDAVKFKKNDVLFGKLRPYLAKVYLVENQGEAVGDIYVLRPNKLIHPQFLKFFMLSEKFIDYVNSSTNGTKMPRANWDFIGCISIFLPHIKVQHEIVEYLESAVLKIELIINKQISLIEKLKEYRSSVISHAVTGKIDIREFC